MPDIEQIPQFPVHPVKGWQRYLIDSLMAVGGALIVTGIIYAFHLYPAIPNISMLYLLVILALASMQGRFAALVAAVVAALSFDFFLVPPLYSFTIFRWEEWIALAVFLVTALLTSQLAAVAWRSVEQARGREREARILYEAGRVVNSTDRLDEQLDRIALSLVRVFSPWGVRACALLLPDANGALTIQADAPLTVDYFTLSSDEMGAAKEVMTQGTMQEIRPSSQATAPARQNTMTRLIPLKAGQQVLGVLCLRIEHGVSWFTSGQRLPEAYEQSADQIPFFWAFLDQTILVIERARLRDRALPNNE